MCDVFKAVSIFGTYVNKLGDTKIFLGKLNYVDSLMQGAVYSLYPIDKAVTTRWLTQCKIVLF